MESRVLQGPQATKDRPVHRVSKETLGHQDPSVPKENRVSKDRQASRDRRVPRVWLAKLDGTAPLGLKAKRAMTVLKVPRDQRDRQDHRAPRA